MCLSIVNKNISPPLKEVIAYKIFYKLNKQLHNPYYSLQGSTVNRGTFIIPVGERLEAKEKRIQNWNFETYTSGFHAYATRAAARILRHGGIVRKVKLEHVHTEGMQHNVRVYVAKYMTVLKDKT